MAKKSSTTGRKAPRTRNRRTSASKKAATRGTSRSGRKGANAPAGPMSVPFLESLVQLMAGQGLVTIELQDGQQRILLSRAAPAQAGYPAATGAQQQPSAPAAPAMPSDPASIASSGAAASPAEARSSGDLLEIRSPMVGTFYTASSPDAPPFVAVGDRVGPDTDVCIIEAMKVFNNIKAETSGVIDQILAENGQAVEYGQVLFLVRPG